MNDELSGLLARAAPQAPSAPALEDLWRRGRRRRQRQRLSFAVTAVAAAMLLVVGALTVFGGLDDDSTEVAAGDAGSWRVVADSPLEARYGHAVVSTGAFHERDTEFLVWGGTDGTESFGDGAVYDPATDTWADMADAPIAPRQRPLAFWWESEMFVWGGSSSDGLVADGAAYDPETDTWRTISRPPIGVAPNVDYAAGRAGGEIVVVGPRYDIDEAEPTILGPLLAVAYDPTTDAWRRLPDPPGEHLQAATAISTGQELIVWGTPIGPPDDTAPKGIAYDPTRETWRTIATPPVKGRMFHSAAWFGSEMVIWGGWQGRQHPSEGAAYRPPSDAWRTLPPAPISGRSGHIVAGGEHRLVFWGGRDFNRHFADGATYDVASDAWAALPPAPLGARADAEAVSGRRSIFIWGGRNDTTAFGDGALYRPPVDDAGDTGESPSSPPGGDSPERGDRVVVDQGEAGDLTWQLVVYEQGEHVCADLEYESRDPDGGTGGGGSGRCGFPVPDRFAIDASIGGGEDEQFLNGVAGDDIVEIHVELISGETLVVHTVGGDLGYDIRFFAALIPGDDAVISITGIDETGQPAARQQFRPNRQPEALKP